jgi:hypothetical protein
MPEGQEKQNPDVAQLWRDWLTQSERQVNAFLGDALNQDVSARSIAGFMEMYAALQRLLADGMQRYLALVNMPSRNDVVGLGETLRAIEDRLSRIEQMLQIAAEAVDGYEREQPATFEPLRTRRPPGVAESGAAPVPEFNDARRDPNPIPEELRR